MHTHDVMVVGLSPVFVTLTIVSESPSVSGIQKDLQLARALALICGPDF